jgi:hypothetical protein
MQGTIVPWVNSVDGRPPKSAQTSEVAPDLEPIGNYCAPGVSGKWNAATRFDAGDRALSSAA